MGFYEWLKQSESTSSFLLELLTVFFTDGAGKRRSVPKSNYSTTYSLLFIYQTSFLSMSLASACCNLVNFKSDTKENSVLGRVAHLKTAGTFCASVVMIVLHAA